MRFLVEATDKYVLKHRWDRELSDIKSKQEGKEIHYFPKAGEQWEVDLDRKELLVEKGFVNVIKEIKDKSKKEKEVNGTKEKKSKKKNT